MPLLKKQELNEGAEEDVRGGVVRSEGREKEKLFAKERKRKKIREVSTPGKAVGVVKKNPQSL